MKVITIKQPFASLIAEGYKKYEFRTWKTKYRGDILIHAGKGIDKEAMKKFESYGLTYPTGCIIAKATLSDCVEVNKEFKDKLRNQLNAFVYSGTTENLEWKGYGFKLENIQKIDAIPVNGMLGLWEYDIKNKYSKSIQWKVIGELTDKIVLGSEGLSTKEPRKTSRAILINEDGKYAVMYAKRFNLHSLPGGGIDDGEDETAALIREVMEETGCTCDIIEPLGIVSENRYHADFTSLSYYFVVKTKSTNNVLHLTEAEVENGTILKWCAFDEMIHLIKDINHETNQRKFLQARDLLALITYQQKK